MASTYRPGPLRLVLRLHLLQLFTQSTDFPFNVLCYETMLHRAIAIGIAIYMSRMSIDYSSNELMPLFEC